MEWLGDQSAYEDWVNVPPLLDVLLDLGEEQYTYSNWLGFISSEMDPAFTPRRRFRPILPLRRVVGRLLRLISLFGL